MTARGIPDVAADLGLSPRLLKRIVVENGLYICAPGSNRKRMLPTQVDALLEILRGEPCQSSHTSEITVIAGSSRFQNRQNPPERLINAQRLLGEGREMRSRVVSLSAGVTGRALPSRRQGAFRNREGRNDACDSGRASDGFGRAKRLIQAIAAVRFSGVRQ